MADTALVVRELGPALTVMATTKTARRSAVRLWGRGIGNGRANMDVTVATVTLSIKVLECLSSCAGTRLRTLSSNALIIRTVVDITMARIRTIITGL